MMKKLILWLLLWLSVIAPLQARQETPVPGPAAEQSVPKRGAFYRVQHNGKTTYLFGTMHVGQPRLFPLEPQVMQALSEADQLVLEADISNKGALQAAVIKHGFYRDGSTVTTHLSPETTALLRRALRRRELQLEPFIRMKPWLIANALLALELERNGYRQAFSVETFLTGAHGDKPVLELESVDYQLSLFDQLRPAQQDRVLRETLVQLENGKGMKQTQAMIDAWARADSKGYDLLLRELHKDKSVSGEFMRKVLLEKRNHEMASKVDELLKQDKSSFIGVGLLHLLGDTGLPSLLRQRGYAVQQVY